MKARPGTAPPRAARRRPLVARVSLLIPSHALPPLSYAVPDRLAGSLRVGSAVVAPLSGHGRLGFVVGLDEQNDGGELKEIRGLAPLLDLPEPLLETCLRVASASAAPLPAVLAAALPPGARRDACEILAPAPGWPWAAGEVVGRRELRRALGGTALAEAEEAGRVALVTAPPPPREVEWAVLVGGEPPRGPKGRMILAALEGHGGAWPSLALLREAGAGRDSLLRLARGGAVRLERRDEATPVAYSRGSGSELAGYSEDAGRALEAERGSSLAWRLPTGETEGATAALARACAGRGEVALVLAPEVADVERLSGSFVGLLPAGLAVAAYHGGMNSRNRAAVHGAFRRGEVDVLVGTRAAALLPGKNVGAVVVVDEPNGAHRAEPGREGVPLHVREVSRQRALSEGAVAVLISPTPTLRLWDPASGVRRLPPRDPAQWPAARVVDVRGTGAAFSSALLDDCRGSVRSGGRVGVLVNRLGRAASLTCARCGHVPLCPRCALPLSPLGKNGAAYLSCRRCGRKEGYPENCPSCGSDRVFETGQAVEGVREALAEALGVGEVGLLTAGVREAVDASVVVGTARYLASGSWDLVAVPDADALLFGGGLDPVEAGFRALYRAAEASRGRVVVQTRNPEHYALLAALRGDYEAFAEAHLPRRRRLGYPPQGHLAEVEVSAPGGPKGTPRAVESPLREHLRGSGVAWTGPTPVAGERESLRVLLRGRGLSEVAGAAARLGRVLAKEGLRVRISVDPEEA